MKHLLSAPARAQTRGEEIANAVSHGLGFGLAVAVLPVLVVAAVRHGSAADVVGAALFAATMAVLYLASTLYHALPAGRAKAWAGRVDHAAIYLFIAGSYTPFTLGVLRGAWGWTLFGLVWGLAVTGIVLKLTDRLRHPWLSTGLYVAMGWLVLVAVGPLADRLSATGLAWLVAGGVAYTLGAVAFMLDNGVRYMHFVWHLAVLAGSACHVVAALGPAYGLS